jgi:hypothetical protein
MENLLTHEEMMARGSHRREGAATIERLDPVLLQGSSPFYLYNIYDLEHTSNQGTAGVYYIPPCPEGRKYVRSPSVIPGVVSDTYPHFGEKEEYRVRAVPGKTIADAAIGIGEGQREDEDLRRFGVFHSQNEKPTSEELTSAKNSLIKGLQRTIRQADQYFASAKPEERVSLESEHFYKAARYLGIKKPWMSEANLMTVCPFCAIGVSPTASICHGCNQIINQAAFDATKSALAGAKA